MGRKSRQGRPCCIHPVGLEMGRRGGIEPSPHSCLGSPEVRVCTACLEPRSETGSMEEGSVAGEAIHRLPHPSDFVVVHA